MPRPPGQPGLAGGGSKHNPFLSWHSLGHRGRFLFMRRRLAEPVLHLTSIVPLPTRFYQPNTSDLVGQKRAGHEALDDLATNAKRRLVTLLIE